MNTRLGAFFFSLIAGAFELSIRSHAITKAPAENPYKIERSFPDYFLEGRKFSDELQGTHQAGDLPVYTVNAPLGYIGNSTFIIGDDGVIVYDTGVNKEVGEHIKKISKVTDKPIKAIFYSHHHTDHYNGASGLVSAEDVKSGKVKIYAWENFDEEVAAEFGDILPRQAMGAFYYGPDILPPEDKHYHVSGYKIFGGTAGYIPPTDHFAKDDEFSIAGVDMKIFYTGGEAISEFGIQIPKYDMVIIADEIFYGLPNLHSIRGSKPRYAENYIKAHDKVLELEPEWLLGSHIIPIQGKKNIKKQVTKYRDATQWMWDQTIRLINKGYTALEIQHELSEIPENLYNPPLTVPLYGTPLTATPGIVAGNVSWFSGDATDLYRLAPKEEAETYIELMDGYDKVKEAAKKALKKNPQLTAQLTQMLVRVDRDDIDARYLKAAGLKAVGYKQINPIMRAWYLKGAMELEGALDPKKVYGQAMQTFAQDLPAFKTIELWRYMLDSESAKDTQLVVGFNVSDTKDGIAVEIRNGVLIPHKTMPKQTDATVTLTLSELNAIAKPDGSMKTMKVKGKKSSVKKLDQLLDGDVGGFYMHIK